MVKLWCLRSRLHNLWNSLVSCKAQDEKKITYIEIIYKKWKPTPLLGLSDIRCGRSLQTMLLLLLPSKLFKSFNDNEWLPFNMAGKLLVLDNDIVSWSPRPDDRYKADRKVDKILPDFWRWWLPSLLSLPFDKLSSSNIFSFLVTKSETIPWRSILRVRSCDWCKRKCFFYENNDWGNHNQL